HMVSGCTSLAGITIPATVTKIGEFAFSECAALEDAALPAGVTEIGRFAFAYTPELKLLPLPETVTTVGHGVFYQSGIEEASLPETITVIPDGMYQCCASLKEFEISNSVTEIEQEAFYWCFALEKITFGENVATIGNKVFTGDKALTSVTSLNPVPPAGAAFESEVYENAILYVPNAAIDAYKAADGWKEFNNIIGLGSGVDEIWRQPAFSVTVAEGGVEVVSDKAVEIFDAAGVKVYSGAPGTVSLPCGFYVIVSGNETVKVVL
ncbi:MAG: leucine-rich repeat domain-containing protein, partial [Muribaculaceae bacterium]|nr:leucine-rich repeat domain-containing protein [Muribaculaceae bacterium]